MKICVLDGSPHPSGFTNELLETFLSIFYQHDERDISYWHTYALEAKPCIDCRVCSKEERCTFSDLDEFYDDFEQCDLFIVSTPVHFLSMPAPLKAVIDRFQRYYSARFILKKQQPIEKKRQSFFISTCGSNDTMGFDIIEKQLDMVNAISNLSSLGSFVFSETDTKNITNEDKIKLLKRAEEIYYAVQTKI